MPSYKVLILSHEYPPYFFGGIGTYTRQLAEYLSLHGFNVYVVAGRATNGFTIERDGSVHVLRVYFPDMPVRSIWYSIFSKNLILELAEKSDVIVSNGTSAGIAARFLHFNRLSRKLVTIFHGTIESIRVFYRNLSRSYISSFNMADLVYYLLLPIYNELNKMDIAYSMKNITIAKHVRDELILLYPDLSDKIKNSKVVYAGINYDEINQTYLSSKDLNKNKDKPIYAYIGRLFATKGARYVPEIFKLISHSLKEPTELWIFGEGPMKSYIMRFSKKERLNVKLFGFIPRKKLLELISKYVDVVIFPSLYEGCPLTILEANALGIPVVTWDLPWAQEFIIEGLNGFKAPFGDLHMFADLAIKAINLRKYAARIHEYTARFDRNKVLKELSDSIENMINS